GPARDRRQRPGPVATGLVADLADHLALPPDPSPRRTALDPACPDAGRNRRARATGGRALADRRAALRRADDPGRRTPGSLTAARVPDRAAAPVDTREGFEGIRLPRQRHAAPRGSRRCAQPLWTCTSAREGSRDRARENTAPPRDFYVYQ